MIRKKTAIKEVTLALVCMGCLLASNISRSQGYADREPELSEEVFVHLSDHVMLAGDDVWMGIQVKTQGQPSPTVVAYMELLDREGNPVKQAMTELVNGAGEGYLEIPENIGSDNYLLRVYTRNSPYLNPSKGIYHRILTVINPTLPPPNMVTQKEPLPTKTVNGNNPFIQTEKETYELREQVRLTLKTGPSSYYSLSVRQLSAFPDYGNKRIDAEAIYDSDEGEFDFIPELYGHIIQGKSLSSRVDTTETFFLSAHGGQSGLFLARPFPNGNLFFETGSFKYFDYVIVQSAGSREQVDFVLESPFFPRRPNANLQLPPLHLAESDKPFILDRLLARETKAYYYPDTAGSTAEVPPFLYPDRTYYLDDYNRFEDMATTFREYVPEVFVRRQDNKIYFRNYNQPYGSMFKNDPLLLVDAMPVFDSDALSRLNPKGIKSLEVVSRYYFFQQEAFEGVISLTSFNNDFGEFELPQSALFIEYPGIQLPRKINNPAISPAGKNRIPDFRHLLYWETGSRTNEVGERQIIFHTSELPGFYEIRLSFFDKEGRWNESTRTIEVKAP